MKVSIIISNYNYGLYLPAAIDSVLAQTYKDIEIVVVDDGSKDNSREVLSQLQEKYPDIIKAIFQENQGQGAAFNTGFAASTGEIIAFLDADDTWKPHKLQRIVETLNEPGIVGVMHQLDTIDGDGNIFDNDCAKKITLPENLAKVVIDTGNAWNFPPTSGLAYRRSALEKVFPINVKKWRICADGCLIYCTAFLGKIKTLNEVLANYRIHGANNHMKSEVVTEEAQTKTLQGIEMTNRYINEFLEGIGYPKKVNLSRNLQYRRTKYYMGGKWDAQQMWGISLLILGWRFYSVRERLYYLVRFLMKNVKFLSSTDTQQPVVNSSSKVELVTNSTVDVQQPIVYSYSLPLSTMPSMDVTSNNASVETVETKV